MRWKAGGGGPLPLRAQTCWCNFLNLDEVCVWYTKTTSSVSSVGLLVAVCCASEKRQNKNKIHGYIFI